MLRIDINSPYPYNETHAHLRDAVDLVDENGVVCAMIFGSDEAQALTRAREIVENARWATCDVCGQPYNAAEWGCSFCAATKLMEQVERLRAALEPFAKFADSYEESHTSDESSVLGRRSMEGYFQISVGDCRNARAAFNDTEQR